MWKHSLTFAGSTGKELLRSFNYQLCIYSLLDSPLCLSHHPHHRRAVRLAGYKLLSAQLQLSELSTK